MPLYVADGSIDPVTLQNVPDEFVIFYSSIIDGQMWCPVSCYWILIALPDRLAFLFIEDCRVVEKLVKETFPEQGPGALIVYVGNKQQFVELPQFL